jgi:squalene cyclase
MEFNLTSVLAGLLGTIVGFFLKATYDYLQYRSERYDKYYFALLNKRFEVYQEANFECEKLKTVVHDQTNKKYEITNHARDWFYQNNLYLSPSLRDSFRRLIFDVEFYGDSLTDFKLTSQETGKDSEQTKTKRIELSELWNNIMGNTQSKLQSDIDKYYDKLESVV